MDSANISVIYMDRHHLVVNKPAGIVIHPTYKHADGTFWDALLAYTQQLAADTWQPPLLPDEPAWSAAPVHIQALLRQQRTDRIWQQERIQPRPCLLHRLDKDTSGVVLLARTERARRHLVRQFEERTLHKRYLAVVQMGAPAWAYPRVPLQINVYQEGRYETAGDATQFYSLSPAEEFYLSGPLQRDPDDRRRCIVGPDGQHAATRVRVLGVAGSYALLDVRPVTGRTHQIRAHLAALGYSIVGDATYAPPPDPDTSGLVPERQFLHAFSLGVSRCPDNQFYTFVAPLASDLYSWLAVTCPSLLDVYRTLPLEHERTTSV